MCEIAGVINFKKNLFCYEAYNRLLVRDMTQSLSDTEPRNSDEWVGEHVALSLSYPSCNKQQILKKTVEGHEFLIACFSNLDNRDELKNDLSKFGYVFTSDLDAEVILYQYIHYGENCCKKLNGLYYFCIWDTMRQQVFICCDKSYIKPFFYTTYKNSIIFATNIKSLFCFPGLRPKTDKDGLCELFTFFPYKTVGMSIFKDVYLLKPASYMIIKRSGVFFKEYCEFENDSYNIDIKSRIKVLKPVIAQTLDLETYYKTRCDYPLILDSSYKENSYSQETTEMMLCKILEDMDEPINLFIDRENALSTPDISYNLIQINNWFKDFNPTII